MIAAPKYESVGRQCGMTSTYINAISKKNAARHPNSTSQLFTSIAPTIAITSARRKSLGLKYATGGANDSNNPPNSSGSQRFRGSTSVSALGHCGGNA